MKRRFSTQLGGKLSPYPTYQDLIAKLALISSTVFPSETFLSNAGKPAPADFLQIRRVARILSKEALLNYASEH